MKKLLLVLVLCCTPLGANAQSDWQVELPFDTVASFVDMPPVPPYPLELKIGIGRLDAQLYYSYFIYPPICAGDQLLGYRVEFTGLGKFTPSGWGCELKENVPLIHGEVCCNGEDFRGRICEDAYEKHNVGLCYTCATERDTLYIRVDSIAPEPQPHLINEPTLRTVRLHFDTVATVTGVQRDGARARTAACPATQGQISVDARGRVCRSATGAGVTVTYRAGTARVSVGTPRR